MSAYMVIDSTRKPVLVHLANIRQAVLECRELNWLGLANRPFKIVEEEDR